MTDSFDPAHHVLAVRASFQTPQPGSGWMGTLQVVGLPDNTTHNQVLEANQDVFSFLLSYRNDLTARERIEQSHGKLTFGYMPYPPPHNSPGNFRDMPERT